MSTYLCSIKHHGFKFQGAVDKLSSETELMEIKF